MICVDQSLLFLFSEVELNNNNNTKQYVQTSVLLLLLLVLVVLRKGVELSST
jgi:hypothetical protein